MKYTLWGINSGKAQVIGVKKFYAKRPESTVKILAKSAALATVSSSGASFLSSRFLLRKKKCGKLYLKIKKEPLASDDTGSGVLCTTIE